MILILDAIICLRYRGVVSLRRAAHRPCGRLSSAMMRRCSHGLDYNCSGGARPSLACSSPSVTDESQANAPSSGRKGWAMGKTREVEAFACSSF
jgi:hypothetical protein